ncbi:Abi family protein [Thalassotalea sp. ND16A]|uniref:Abi family protein n=1 Tax=Thalassotalea sp. ND16A TaxID=1535422 RepID=UPI00051D69A7|nr:Abi family protein [Thalassotalea sp. ND16A]KGJ88106.1 hypothetical protein ND16A_2659 [Thalassotalea sp. ND16A]
MRALNHLVIEPFISGPRLAKYKSFFNSKSNVELFGCYLWNKDIVSAFFPIIQLVEVALRNAIHNHATSSLGRYWFDNLATKSISSLTFVQQGNVRYHGSALNSARNQIRQELNLAKHVTISADRIVAKMTFGFWTNLFRVPFEVNRNPQALWPALIRPVFPNLPRGHRGRVNIHTHIQAIQTFRNKAFHHEPVWNIGRPASVPNAINELHSQKELLIKVLKWLSKDAVKLAERSGYIANLNLVLSQDYLNHLQNPNDNEKALSVFKRELNSILKQDTIIVDLMKNNELIAKVYSSR